jgi:hypothetical protein
MCGQDRLERMTMMHCCCSRWEAAGRNSSGGIRLRRAYVAAACIVFARALGCLLAW